MFLAVLVALAAVVVDKLVLTPLLWDVRPAAASLALSLVASMLSVFGPILGYLWLTRPARPAAFTGSGPVLSVPGWPVYQGLLAIALLMQTYNLLPLKLDGDFEFTTTAAVTALLALAAPLLPGPALTLTAAGLTVRGLVRSRTVAWDDLVPGGPHPVSRWTMPLLYRTGDGPPSRVTVLVSGLRIDHAFLAATIRDYAAHPAHRPA